MHYLLGGAYFGDSTQLTYLRSRFYASGTGRFLTRDTWGGNPNSPITFNQWVYADTNPINRTDPSGLMSGLEAFVMCFNIHSISQVMDNSSTLRGVTAQQAVDICKLAYSRDAWSLMPFGTTTNSAHNLFGIYLNEPSENDRLIFTARDKLTRELANSQTLRKLRQKYVQFGETLHPREYQFDGAEQAQCISDYRPSTGLSVPLTCFLGGFYYQLKTVNMNGSTFVGFRIDNRTDLESGTHIALRHASNGFSGSVEDLIANHQITGNEPILQVMNNEKAISILRALDRTKTDWYTSSLGTHELGSGNLVQTYVWMEKYDPCDPLSRLTFLYSSWHFPVMWVNWYPPITEPIPEWKERY